MEMLNIGDMAVYPAQGVARVSGIETKEVMSKKITFYVLNIIDTDMQIMVPVEKAMAVGLRQIIQEEELPTLYGLLHERNVKIDRQTWNRRYRGFMDKLKTGKIQDVALVYRDLCLLRNDKVLSFGERRMLDTARNLIVKELSIAKRMSEQLVELELEGIFSTPRKEELPEARS